jgi:ribonuclease P protein component
MAGRAGRVPIRPSGPFGKEQRLRKRAEFQDIQGDGRRVFTRNFVLMLAVRAGWEERVSARLGVTVSRRVGNAPQRNRAKRLIREAFRATRELWPPDVDVVVIARGPLGPLRLGDVVGEFLGVRQPILRRAQEARQDYKTRKDRLAETR